MRGGPLVVVGDALLDIDIDGTTDRLAPDAPVPVVHARSELHRPGGAGLTAVLAAGLSDREVVLVSGLGTDRQAAVLRELLQRRVEVLSLPMTGGTPTKMRIKSKDQLIVRLDAGEGRVGRDEIPAPVHDALRSASAIVVADYGRGLAAHPGLTAALAELSRQVPIVWDPHPAGPGPVRGARLVTPNQAEARWFARRAGGGQRSGGQESGDQGFGGQSSGGQDSGGQDSGGLAEAVADAASLVRQWGCPVAVTLGSAGALLSVGDEHPLVVPARPLASSPGSAGPVDSCGAGDCFAAAAGAALASGLVLSEVVQAAVRSATEFVQAGGATAAPGVTTPAGAPPAPTGTAPTGAAPAGAAPAGQDGDRLAGGHADPWTIVARVRARGGKVVATGGCFDLLHAGHVGLLAAARQLGDCLIVCLNSDRSVRKLKGPGRPIVKAHDRAAVLMALDSVDAVIVFDEPTPAAILERLRPDVWAKGGDYAHGELAEAATVRRSGGQVVMLPYLGRHSTTRLVEAAGRSGEDGQDTGRPR
jgi:D-beta-D-heptose 7-phosphate kinase / D-beta-D-heptose 1-phosphate adenosyltransferase